AMALLWISGRTALVLVAASLASAIAVVRGRLMAAAACLLIALFAKEEAVALPFMLACWLVVLGRAHPGRVRIHPVVWLLVSFSLLAAYFLLRDHAGAFTPASAPPYYRFTFAPAVLTSHILQYADRSLTWPAAVCL